ncbi:hypothetical protein NYZ99_00035 [Maribacter litopenaei]|uniref:Uncharacterized protein n=1 Tax=Maribacter litopenaei TaxID=2976127 RepID=A0ABY5Y7U6_9FLAO|nr:hypothetical protein [Maribacter litopenaei]UWX55090.1 hypothetical protein NYZ99_00035 [Maribacter litopenaei]
MAKSMAVPNNPAFPEIPPRREAFSSCTHPWVNVCLYKVSISVGTIRFGRFLEEGKNPNVLAPMGR